MPGATLDTFSSPSHVVSTWEEFSVSTQVAGDWYSPVCRLNTSTEFVIIFLLRRKQPAIVFTTAYPLLMYSLYRTVYGMSINF